MRILSIKPGHDGHLSYIQDGELVFSIEAEKDSGYRYAALDAVNLVDIMQQLPAVPDVLALSGWTQGADPFGKATGMGYFGLDNRSIASGALFGSRIKIFSSSHERSHILCAFALSPFAVGQRCYALVWEGYIGSFYQIDERVNITRLADIMIAPGARYAFAYALADPSFALPAGHIRLSDAGKVMALAAYAPAVLQPSAEETQLLDRILGAPLQRPRLDKADFRSCAVLNSGVESAASTRLASLISRQIWAHFERSMRPLVREPLPLLISGGCGLNCDWNRQWLDSGLFSDVFVPPCPNDAGSAIGTAADAQLHFCADPKLGWDVYRGAAFLDDTDAAAAGSIGAFVALASGVERVAELLANGAILGWVAGKCELGPRALGNRSIIAAPFSKAVLARLNRIKQREQFRPIAPMCVAEDAALHFDLQIDSPHMLYFAKVKSAALQAICHVDGSARVQTVSASQNPALYTLLTAFKRRTGFGVLCNTSLNFNGKGFINRTSDLSQYAQQSGLDGFVIEGKPFVRRALAHRFS